MKFLTLEVFPSLMDSMGVMGTLRTLELVTVEYGFKCLWERNGLPLDRDLNAVTARLKHDGERKYPDDGVAEGLLDNIWCASTSALYQQMSASFERIVYAPARKSCNAGCEVCLNCVCAEVCLTGTCLCANN